MIITVPLDLILPIKSNGKYNNKIIKVQSLIITMELGNRKTNSNFQMSHSPCHLWIIACVRKTTNRLKCLSLTNKKWSYLIVNWGNRMKVSYYNNINNILRLEEGIYLGKKIRVNRSHVICFNEILRINIPNKWLRLLSTNRLKRKKMSMA